MQHSLRLASNTAWRLLPLLALAALGACVTPPDPLSYPGATNDAGEMHDVATPQPLPPQPPAPALPSPRPTTTVAATSDNPVYSGTFEAGSGRRVATLTVMGERREVVVYVPANRSTPSPLVVLFHGTNGSGTQMLDDSGARALADAQGVVVIAPTARHMSQGDWDHTTEDTYWETWPNTDIHTNQDVVLTRAIVAEAQRVYATDSHRVYFMGHSNGGFFAQMAATLLRDRTAGFAASSAGIVPCATTQSCHFEGNADSCAALRVREGWCACNDTVKSIALPNDGYMPGAYLTHGTHDATVSVQYTCALEAGLHALHAPVTTVLRLGDGHVMPSTFARDAWSVIGAYTH